MNSLLYLNLTTKAITDGSGSTWSASTQTFGETWRLGLRLLQTVDGVVAEATPTVNYAKAALGSVDARPTSGKWKIKIGDAPQSNTNTTAAIDWNCGAVEVEKAINALEAIVTQFGSAAVKTVGSSYLIKFGSGAALVPLELIESELHPPCFARVDSWQVAGAWISDFRLIQAPVAFADTATRILPETPSITRIQAGGGDETFSWNEIQQLEIPPTFRGSYQFRRNNVRSALLSISDDASAIADALATYGSGIAVTNPRDNIARIEFGGDFAGTSQPLLEICVVDAPEGDLTLFLELDKAPLAAMLRTEEEITLPLEIELGIADENAAGEVRVEKFRTEVTIRRGMIYAMLATAAGIDWLRPIAQDYIPFTSNQIITGQQFYACALGDGETTVFTVDHQLATDVIAAVLLRENSSEGRALVQGVDYSWAVGGQNSVTITLLNTTTPPDTAALVCVISAAGPKSVFQAHTHTIQQIIGLEAELESIGQRLTALEAYLPSATPTDSDSEGTTLTINLPSITKVLFYNPKKLDLDVLPATPPLLLPAVHKADPATLPSPLPSPVADGLWMASARTEIRNSGRIGSGFVEEGGFVASDGRLLFVASNDGLTVSYHPEAFERLLWEFPINAAQLQAKRTLEGKFSVFAQLINASCEAQWVFLIEWGLPVDQSNPSNEGLNLETIAWNSTPILAQRIYVTDLLVSHQFGVRIKNTPVGITADKLLYGGWQTAGTAHPDSADFMLRGRLAKWDTRNNVHDATGWLYYGLTGPDGGDSAAKFTIS